MKQVFLGVYNLDGQLCTENSAKGLRVYGEKLVKQNNREYRMWDPFRSKLAAAILKGLRNMPIRQDSNVLYLGASTGTTASHVADMTKGFVYCVEVSQRMMRELLPLCAVKKNMIPILGDAKHPQSYAPLVGSVDVIYQDVAQKNQAEILLRNLDYYQAKDAMLAIKARSISSVKDPKVVFKEELGKLRGKYNVLETVDLKPYDKDHMMVSVKARK
ncbi:MAG: fibrillarin-like rRNA/tRNA 2'-O-methyltransferase [Candidatus Altiarchaeales archaeon]|nr:fibrillarin-like rRNA/tRNA 2'-O-methyltransferase [Candidatus Altiarchaeales archaeon]